MSTPPPPSLWAEHIKFAEKDLFDNYIIKKFVFSILSDNLISSKKIVLDPK
jgi:hypothetical protein